jgi:hypothetical protein
MNAHSAIVADPADIAIDRANEWAAVAEPIIRAYLALDQIERDLHSGALLTGARFYADIVHGAAVKIGVLQERLRGEIESVRENMISDVFIPGPNVFRRPSDEADAKVWDAEWDAADEANKRVDREVIGVDAAIKRVERML